MKKFLQHGLISFLLFFAVQVFAQNLIVEYEFDGTLSDRLEGSSLTAFGPEVISLHNNIESGFLEDNQGTYWYWQSNQTRGGGFWIDVDQNISENYSVGVRFSYNDIGSSWDKIIDYNNRGSDNGFYFYNGHLQFYEGGAVGTGSTTITQGQLVDLIITRGTGTPGPFKAYFVVDGTLITPAELNVSISGGKPVLVNGKPRFGFFFDDDATSSEATTGGKVYSIKIWDAALTEAEIQAAMNPSATISNVHITGTTGNPIVPKDVVVTILKEGVSIASTIAQNTDLSAWITNLPAGLIAKAKNQITAGSTSFTLEVYSTATEESSEAISMNIPASAISQDEDMLVAQNTDAKFGISPYTVSYNGNSNTSGTAPSDGASYFEGSTVTVLNNTGNLAKTGFTYQGWNSKPDGSGITYTGGESFIMGTSNVILYARWSENGTTPPGITTQAVSAISTTTATGNGNITDLGSPNPTAYGVCWSTSQYPSIDNANKVDKGSTSSTGAFTANITGLITATTYYVRAYATNNGGTSYGEQVSFTTGVINWTGNTNSDWNTAGNWSAGVPGIADDVAINSSDNQPVIGVDDNASCNNLSVNAGANLTIQHGGSLITNGNISNNGTINIAQTLANDGKWHFISIPNNSTIANTFLNQYLQSWDEANKIWQDITNPEILLSPIMKGYSLWSPGGGKGSFTFTGTPNTGNQSISLDYHDNSEQNDGANLLGNPYPSYIDWNQVTGYGSKYTWNGTAYDQRTEAGAGDGSRYVAPMEGFFVVTASAGNTFTLTNDVRTHNSAKKEASAVTNGIVLSANSETYSDALFIVFDESAAENFELPLDAWKFISGTTGICQLWSKCSDGSLAVDVRPEQETIQLGFTNNEAGTYSIELQEIDGISEATLEDTQLNQFHNLTNGAYNFGWQTTDSEERFILHLKATGTSDLEAQAVQVYAAGGQVYVRLDKSASYRQMTVFDLAGRVIAEYPLQKQDLQSFDLNYLSGVYLVQLNGENGTITEKVFLK